MYHALGLALEYLKEKYEIYWGPGIRTQVLQANASVPLPLSQRVVIVSGMNNKHYMIKQINMPELIKRSAKI